MGCTISPVSGAAIQRIGICSTCAPSVWKMRLTLAFCSAKPNWIPRNPKHMFQICQNDTCGLEVMMVGSRGGAMPRNEICVVRQLLRGLGEQRAEVPQITLAVGGRHGFDERMRCSRTHPLSPQHLQPARHLEQIVGGAEDARRLAKQLDPMPQRIRYRHGAAGVPERFAAAVVDVVVQDDEVPDVFVLRGHRAVEFLAALRTVAAMWKQQDQPLNRDLYQVNGRGFERLEETAGEPHAYDVAVPQLLAASRRKTNQPRLGERRRIEIREQQLACTLVARVRGRIDVTVAGAMLQRDAPLP